MVIGITGASGFVGRHLVDRLDKEGYTTRVLLRDTLKDSSASEKVKGDLETGDGLEEFVSGVDLLINLVGRFQPPFKDQVIGNAVTLENLCQAANKAGVKKVIYVSAAAVYGVPSDGQIFSEEDKPAPDTTYALSKQVAEEVAEFYNRNFGLSFVILRPPNIYGPGSDHGVVYNFIKNAKETGELTIHGDGTQQRDFLFVDDLVDAILKSISYETEYDVFNISTGEPKDLNELASTLEKVMGKEINITHQGEAQGAKVVTASYEKANRVLSWEPKTSLEEGLLKTISS